MPLALFALCALLAAQSHATLWIGMSPQPNQPQSISLFTLSAEGAAQDHLATILLTSPEEHVSVDSFRCRPYGTFCLMTTTNNTDSWLYNITFATGKYHKTELPVCSSAQGMTIAHIN